MDAGERNKLRKEYNWKYFERFDSLLDSNWSGPDWLKNNFIAEMVIDSIHYRDGKVYDLLAYTIMLNHVHLVFSVERFSELFRQTMRDGVSHYIITNIVGSLKKHTALESNKILKRTGAFWQNESYHHVIRDGAELDRTIWYVLLNPVKAGFVNNWKDWKWSYYKPGLLDI